MKHLKIAYSFDVQYCFVDSDRDIVPIEETDFTDVAVADPGRIRIFLILTPLPRQDSELPIMVIMPGGEKLPEAYRQGRRRLDGRNGQ